MTRLTTLCAGLMGFFAAFAMLDGRWLVAAFDLTILAAAIMVNK